MIMTVGLHVVIIRVTSVTGSIQVVIILMITYDRALGATRSLRFLPRLKLSNGVVDAVNIIGKCGSSVASSVIAIAFLIVLREACIAGVYVTTNGVPMLVPLFLLLLF